MVTGGHPTYGEIAGILMMESTAPRLPGDPGHAATFDFPVRYAVLKGYPFDEMITGATDHLDIILDGARELEAAGVKFVAGDCGLFSIFQERIASELSIPFLGSALSLVPMLKTTLPPSKKIGVITGAVSLLNDAHLSGAGIDPDDIVLSGMDDSPEFKRVVIDRAPDLDPQAMRRDILVAAKRLQGLDLGCVILECTNLITYRQDVQTLLNLPVYDMVSFIEMMADGYRSKQFHSPFI